MTMAIPQVGDQVYLGSTNALAHWYGCITDGEVPGSVTATMEWGGNQAVISLAALVGPEGPAGQDADIVKMQYGLSITSPADLPGNLLNEDFDIGKAYWVGNNVYIWTGVEFEQHQMGTAGPVGPVPDITFSVALLDPSGTTDSYVNKTGTDLQPNVQLNLKVPRGPAGPSGPIRGAADYDNTVAPVDRDVISWNAGTQKYAPRSLTSMIPTAYSVPEAAFSSTGSVFVGSAIVPIGSFAVPPQPFDWIPWVTGHIKGIGAEISTDPFQVGCEVLLGDLTAGVLVGRGFGNIASWANISPHFSTPSNAAEAVTPTNGYAVVPANHTGNEGTLYVNLANDGIAGAVLFNSTNAQLSVLCIPVA